MRRAIVVVVGAAVWGAPIAAVAAPTYGALGERIAAAWRPLASGAYPPPSSANYATALLGDVQVRTGLARRDRALLWRGARSVTAACRHPTRHRPFQLLAIADAYLSSVDGRSAYLERHRGIWERCLRRARPSFAERWDAGSYGDNWQLVEWAARVLIGRAGITSGDPRTLASGAFDTRIRRVLDRLPRLAISGGGCFVGDPGSWPFAYDVFVAAMLRIAGDPLADCAATGVRAIAAPDGDIAYSGRSYQQSWVLAASAFVLLRSGHEGEAAAAYGRLRPYIHRRVRITPCMCDLDRYAHVPTYNGLTAFFLLQAGDVRPVEPTYESGEVRSSLFRISRSATRFTAEILIGAAARGRPHDGRYRGGVVRDKALRGDGWVDLAPELRSDGPTD